MRGKNRLNSMPPALSVFYPCFMCIISGFVHSWPFSRSGIAQLSFVEHDAETRPGRNSGTFRI